MFLIINFNVIKYRIYLKNKIFYIYNKIINKYKGVKSVFKFI
jgi:hypothetical protein